MGREKKRLRFVRTGQMDGLPVYDVFVPSLGYYGTVRLTVRGDWRARGRMEHTRGFGDTKQDAVADVLKQEGMTK